MLQVEVAFKEAKEDSTGDDSTEEAKLRKSVSVSFERVSQEIEKASQELPQAKQALSKQHSRGADVLAGDVNAGAEDSMAPSKQHSRGGNVLAEHVSANAEQSGPSAAQRAPLQLVNETRPQARHDARHASQRAPNLSSQQSGDPRLSQQTGSTVSRGSTQSVSEAGRPLPAHHNVRRPAPHEGQPSIAGSTAHGDPGHIVPGQQQSSIPTQGLQQQHVQPAARGLSSSGPHQPQQQPQSNAAPGSQRDPFLQRPQITQTPQHASRPGQAQQLSSQPHSTSANVASRSCQRPRGSALAQSKPAAAGSSQASQAPSQAPVSTHAASRQLLSACQPQQHHASAVQPPAAPGARKHAPTVQTVHPKACTGQEKGVTADQSSDGALRSSQQPSIPSSSHGQGACQSTGVFAKQNTGVFADDDNDDDDDWDADLAKLLESTALSRPAQDPQHAQVSC